MAGLQTETMDREALVRRNARLEEEIAVLKAEVTNQMFVDRLEPLRLYLFDLVHATTFKHYLLGFLCLITGY